MNKKVREIDTLKALSIIGVIFMHMEFRSQFSDLAMSIINNLQISLGWCVLAFFFCSGFLLKPEQIKLKNLNDYIFKRAHRLLIPCISFSILYKIALILLSGLNIFSWKTNIPSSFFEIFNLIFYPVGPQFYFLVFLFWVSTLVFFFNSITKNVVVAYIGILILFTLFYIQVPSPLTLHGPGLELIPAYTVAFAWGFLFRFKQRQLNFYLGLTTLFVVAFLCFLKQTYVFIYILIPAALFILFTRFKKLNDIAELSRLGEKSSAIYVWHAPLLLPFWSIVADRLVKIDLIEIIFILIMTITSCYFISEVVERFTIFKPLRF